MIKLKVKQTATDGEQLELLAAPEYSEEEKERIVQYFMELKSEFIREFFGKRGLPTSGVKSELELRLVAALQTGRLGHEELVRFVDLHAIVGKQHVFLYDGPQNELRRWRDAAQVQRVLKQNKVGKLLNAQLPLILPGRLSLTSIRHVEGESLEIVAVQKREGWSRDKGLDEVRNIKGNEVAFRAYKHSVTRGVFCFRWNLVANHASLHISQLPSGDKYEDEERKMAQLFHGFLDITHFTKINVGRAIKRLSELEETGNPETRSHGVGYKSPGGRIVSAQSPTMHDSIRGEKEIDVGLTGIRKASTGHLGNLYWLPSKVGSVPIKEEVHTILIGKRSRINFPTPNRRDVIDHVLSRVRAHSK